MEYAQARIQSRFGERPSRASWLRLEGVRETGSFMEAANRTGLQRWIAGLDERSPWHRVELALRERLRGAIRETARWMPSAWRDAFLWTLHLVDLPALAGIARGEAVPSWMHDDPVMHFYLDGDASRRPSGALDNAHRLLLQSASLDAVKPQARGAWGVDASMLAEWFKLWKRTWPANRPAESEGAAEMARQFAAHLSGFESCTTPDRANALRAAWEDELRRSFRRGALLPVAGFAFLALTALDLERLRAMLAERMLIAHQEDRP